MTDLIEFLKAQLDDDERVAREATQGDWRWGDPGGPIKMALMADRQIVVPSRMPDVYPSRYDAEHIARWDPARVLAEVDAKRQIIAEHQPTEGMGYLPDGGYDGIDPACTTCGTADEYATPWPCHTLRLLALPYAAHPDYRSEWAP